MKRNFTLQHRNDINSQKKSINIQLTTKKQKFNPKEYKIKHLKIVENSLHDIFNDEKKN